MGFITWHADRISRKRNQRTHKFGWYVIYIHMFICICIYIYLYYIIYMYTYICFLHIHIFRHPMTIYDPQSQENSFESFGSYAEKRHRLNHVFFPKEIGSRRISVVYWINPPPVIVANKGLGWDSPTKNVMPSWVGVAINISSGFSWGCIYVMIIYYTHPEIMVRSSHLPQFSKLIQNHTFLVGGLKVLLIRLIRPCPSKLRIELSRGCVSCPFFFKGP